MVNFLVLNDSITLHYGGKTKVVAKGDPRFEQVRKAIREKDLESIPGIVDLEKGLRDAGLDVEDGVVSVQGEAMPTELMERVKAYRDSNLPFDSLLAFWKNLKLNPSFNSRKQLFRFLQNKGHSITPDGCFIGYRGVTEDFKDRHTKTFDNSPGSVCEIPRNAVDDNPNNTCSYGLHVGGFEYAKDFGKTGKLVLVKVNPKDVVAVPEDYNGQKMRVCRFKVVEEVQDMITTPTHSTGDEDEKLINRKQPQGAGKKLPKAIANSLDIKVGQIWKEQDSRRNRRVKILHVGVGYVDIQNTTTKRKTSASIERFNNKSKGYKLVRK